MAPVAIAFAWIVAVVQPWIALGRDALIWVEGLLGIGRREAGTQRDLEAGDREILGVGKEEYVAGDPGQHLGEADSPFQWDRVACTLACIPQWLQW